MTFPNIPLYDIFYEIILTGDISLTISSEKKQDPLRVEFEIVRKSDKFVNQSTISIYNLTIENMINIQKLSNINIKINGGYKNKDGKISGLLIDAPVQYSRVIREDTDYILTMIVVEGYQSKNDVMITKYNKGQLIANVFDSLGKNIDGNLYISPDVQGVMPHDLYVSDTPSKTITKVAQSLGLKTVWHNRTLHIYAENIPLKNELVEINYKSGLINYPSIVNASTVKIQTLLNPAIPFLGNVKIDSTETLFIDLKDYNQSYAWLKNISNLGIMEVISQRHKGDTRGEGVGSWMTEIEAIG